MERLYEKDDNGNVIKGNVVSIDTKKCIIIGSDKLIATLGIEDVIVVDTEDVLLKGKKKISLFRFFYVFPTLIENYFNRLNVYSTIIKLDVKEWSLRKSLMRKFWYMIKILIPLLILLKFEIRFFYKRKYYKTFFN